MNVENGANLPPGWAQKTIGQLYDVVGGGTPSTAVEEYWTGDIPWITSADIHGLNDIQPRKNITKAALLNSATNYVPSNTIIVVTRVSLGKVALTPFPLCFSQDSQALLPKDDQVFPDYALYYLSQATQAFKHQSRGTTISGVTKKQLKDLVIPLPPLPEQKRIVARIESLFTQLDAGVSALKRAKAALKRYKASVLKAACEGRLVAQDPNDEPAEEVLKRILAERGEKYVKPDGELAAMPRGWCWARMQNIADINKRNPFLKDLSDETQVTFVPMSAVDAEYGIIANPRIRALRDVKKGYTSFSSGDVIFAKITPCMENGKAAIARNLENDAGFGSTEFHVIRPRECLFADYIYHFVRQDSFRKEAKAQFKGTAGQLRVPSSFIENYIVPLPPFAEQQRIVQDIERRLSVVQELEQTIEANLKRAGRLRQAILKRAFEGRLV